MRLRSFFALMTLGLLCGCLAPREKAPPSARTPYDEPLISIGTKFMTLPPVVQHTIRAQVGLAEISEIVKDTTGPSAIYRIYFVNARAYPPLFVASDGSVLNPDLTVAIPMSREDAVAVLGPGPMNMTLADLPAPVLKTLKEQAPDAPVRLITKETWGSRIVYMIAFTDRNHPSIYIMADGTVMSGGGK